MRVVEKILKKFRIWILGFTLSGLVVDILFFGTDADFITVFLLAFLVLSIKSWKIKGKVSLAVALALLVTTVFLLILNRGVIAERVTVWSYLLFVIGAVQMLLEELSHKTRQ